jgi:Kazal-type serine protease inhibitor domain
MRIFQTLILLSFLALSGSGAYALKAQQNGKTVDVPVCGGFAGLQCNDDQWCDYPEAVACGIADHFGVCRPRPEVCIKIYQPVCGCDGKTHGNACEAAAAGVDVAHAGICEGGGK